MKLHVNTTDWRAWFRSRWRTAPAVAEVMEGYRAINRKTLADISARGFIYTPTTAPNDAITSAFNDGRRSLALEIIELAEASPSQLRKIIEQNPGA